MKISTLNVSKILVVSLSVITSVILLFLSIGVFYIVLTKRNSTKDEKISHTYRLLQYNTRSNRSSVGFTEIYEDLGENDYIFYEGKDNTVSLISNFDGGSSYMCTASCFCNEESSGRRGSISVPISKAVIYLVAAVSSVVAYDKARDFFETDCIDKLSDSCPTNAIQSEMDDCTPTYKDLDTMKVPSEQEKGESREYLCSGACAPFDLIRVVTKYRAKEIKGMVQLKSKKKEMKKARMKFGCRKLKMQSEVSVTFSEPEKVMKEKDREKIAIDHFCKTHFNTYCQKNSLTQMGREEGDTFPMCSGKDERNKNPSLKCIEKVQ